MRALDANGDMTFGKNAANFLVNSPAAVRQIVQTRLLLWTGEWFLDQDEGTPYTTRILGNGTQSLYDSALTERMLDSPGVIAMTSYQSQLDGTTRKLTVAATLDTQFGSTPLVTIPPGTDSQPAADPVLILNLPGFNTLGRAILG